MATDFYYRTLAEDVVSRWRKSSSYDNPATYLREQIEKAFVARDTAARITELEADLTRYVDSLRYMREAADRQRAIMQSAHVDGVRAGLEAAAKAILVAQYDPAPYTKASYAIRALDPEAIVRAGIKVTPAP